MWFLLLLYPTASIPLHYVTVIHKVTPQDPNYAELLDFV